MSLDDLYQCVTGAILAAEAAETAGSPIDVARAYLTVSFVEEEIADLLGAGEEEGAVARRGAVRAALTAGLPVRAKDLAARYAADPDAPPELVDQLREMIERADALLAPSASWTVVVIPEARYRLHDEAA